MASRPAGHRRSGPAAGAALRDAHGRGARLIGLCVGAFTLAATGLLDGREVATHWAYAGQLTKDYPKLRVRADVLWCDHGDILTSAGVTAALDCCMHVVRTDHGVEFAKTMARYLVMAPHREGNQAQYLTSPITPADMTDPIGQATAWARKHLHEPIGLDLWSQQVSLSRRTFTRRFRDRMGQSCHDWLTEQRLELAKSLLERTEHSVERVATAAGFRTAEALRHHFRQRLDTTPALHRRAFRRSVPTSTET